MTAHCCEMMRSKVESTCDQHPDRAACPDSVLSYSDRTKRYLLLVHDGEEGYANAGYSIDFCPWCGTKLPDPVEMDLSELDD